MEDIFDVFLRSIRLFKNPSNEIAGYKGTIRDVVNNIDLDVSNLFLDFYEKKLKPKNFSFICEEKKIGSDYNNCLLVDPLDGSYNFAVGLKEYCSMACLVRESKIIQSGIYVPNDSFIFCVDHLSGEIQSTINDNNSAKDPNIHKPICYAYSPSKTQNISRDVVLNEIDIIGCGFVRYGSAGYGLYQCLIRKLDGFVGQKVRVWDVIPMFNLLRDKGFKIYYSINGENIDVFVHNKPEIIRKFLDLKLFNNMKEFCGELVWQA